jgi:tetratricopeptide (TPR) repeat protein
MMWLLAWAFLAQTPDFEADGIKALDAKQYAAAADLFSKAVAADPKDYAAHFHLALALSLENKDAEAIAEYKSTLALKPALYEAELNLGILQVRAKNPADAIALLKDAAAQKPKEFRPAVFLAQALLDHGDFADAQSAFTAALAINPNAAAAEYGLGLSLARQNHLAEAEPHYHKAAALDASYKSQLLELAGFYESAHQSEQAVAIYKDFPNDPGAQERMGALLSESGRAADAIPALEASVAKSPTAANRVALAQAYAHNKQPEKALPLLEKVLAETPNDFDLRLYYGRILRDQKKYQAAADQFLAAAKIQPAAVQPWNELSAVLVIAGDYPQALTALDRVRALGGETPAHIFFRAISYDHLHQLKEALANYNEFLEKSHGNPDQEFQARQRARIIKDELNRK